MKTLAIDTSGKAVSVAIAVDGVLYSHIWLRHGRTHAEALMPCVDAALSGLELELRDVDVYAAVSGPGSFTGLRIGVAAVKALAYANNAKTVGVSTLDALAMNLDGHSGALICPVMDARNGNVYQAIYGPGGGRDALCAGSGLTRLAEASLVSAAEAAERLNKAFAGNRDLKRLIFNGDGAAVYINYFQKELAGICCSVATEPQLYQNASSAAILACGAAAEGRLIPPEQLVPKYLNAGYAGTV